MNKFYNNKKVFITGNTGFKGTWLSYLLLEFGADLYGYSHKPNQLFSLCGVEKYYPTIYGDIRDYEKLRSAVKGFNPDVVLHLAAQPLVIEGYNNPRETFEVNVMGTVNLMAALQASKNLGSIVNVTTDKVYRNLELGRPYSEEDQLGGSDPYSCSKACSELVTNSFGYSYKQNYTMATARAGNVIGGGDFAENRILPDCIKSAVAGETIKIRNSKAIRPWQHVLEPLSGYLVLAKALYENKINQSSFNFGPELEDCISVGELADLFCKAWGNDLRWQCIENLPEEHANKGNSAATFRESNLLTLDSSKANRLLKWQHRWNVREAVEKTVEWHKHVSKDQEAEKITIRQIKEYLKA